MQWEQGGCQRLDTEAGDRERRAVAIKHLVIPLLLCYTEDILSLSCCLPCGEESRDAEFAYVLSAAHSVRRGTPGLGKRLCRQSHLSQISPAPNFQDNRTSRTDSGQALREAAESLCAQADLPKACHPETEHPCALRGLACSYLRDLLLGVFCFP